MELYDHERSTNSVSGPMTPAQQFAPQMGDAACDTGDCWNADSLIASLHSSAEIVLSHST